MMTQWYYANSNNQQQGPVEAAVILDKLAKGELSQSTLVWRDGMAGWQPISVLAVQLQAPSPAPPARPEITAAAAAAPPQSPYAAPASTLSVGDGAVLPTLGHGIVYAGFWRRVAANVIDGMIVNALSVVLMLILLPLFGVSMAGFFGFNQFWDGPANPEDISAGMVVFQLVLQLVIMVLTCAYYAWFHASHNMATLGKMAVGIKVVRADGRPITLGRGIGRYFAFMLSSFTLGIGFLMAAFSQRKQALHDMICDTLVVDKWAFTERPDLQQKGLGTVTIVVLVLFALLMAVLFFAIIGLLMAGIAAGMAAHY